MSEPAYITCAQAAAEMGYTVQHVRRLVRSGRLDGQKLGRDWLVLRSSVNRFIAARENLGLSLESSARSNEA